MRWVERALSFLSAAFSLGCVATVMVQVTGGVLAASQGLLSPDKMLRYAGVLYGLEPLDMAPPKAGGELQPAAQTREEILAERVKNTPYLAERDKLVSGHAEQTRSRTLALKRNREKYVLARDGFEALLDQLETETEASALGELRITMEIIAPKQAKDILTTMLATPPTDPSDNVLADVTGIIKSLPDNRLRKILAEFKSDEERAVLHRLLVEIGDLDARDSQLSRAPP